jgi:hypothetical protein
MCLLGALIALNIFLLAYQVTGRAWIAAAVWLPMAFSNPLMTYSYMIFTELPVGLLLIYAFRRLALGWAANGPWRLLLVGLCIGYIPWLAWRCVPLAATLSIFALVQWLRYRRAQRVQELELAEEGQVEKRNSGSFFTLLWVAGPVALSAVLLALFHLFLFGRVVPNNEVPELGSRPIFNWPWAGMEGLNGFLTGAFGHLLDRQFGLLPYAPIYVLAVVGIIAMVRSIRDADRRLLIAIAAVTLPYVGVITAFELWHGIWGAPARYLTTLLPLLAAPLATSLFALARSWIFRAIYVLLALPGFVLMAVMMYDARLMWPSDTAAPFGWLYGAAESPVRERVDLRNFLPAFEPIDEERLPANSAWMLIVAVLLVLAGYLLLKRMGRGQRASTLALRGQGAAWLASLAVLGSAWTVINYDYIKHRTTLVQLQRWDLSVPPVQSMGIGYLDGRVYVTDYSGPGLWYFDISQTLYGPLTAIAGTTTLSYALPGDVVPAPDGTLYVLNNGNGLENLLVMKPDGTVVRQMPLDGKTQNATDLTIGPDGALFVSDMYGGKVNKYPATGGPVIQQYGGMAGGFNNPAGLAVHPDGTLFVAEQGYSRVQELKPDGEFVRSHNLNCQPWYLVINGDWVDISCAKGIYSLNKKTGTLQPSRVDGGAPRLSSPKGMTYAPDGTLYVLDGSTLVQYRVEH